VQHFTNKTAFVTGGASDIGLALGKTFAAEGMKVMLADIEAEALTAALGSLSEYGPNVRGTSCDVTDPVSVERAAQATFEAFGNVHVVCNNAGVGGSGGIDNISLDTWRWVLDVNLWGVLHGIRTFLPHIRAHGEGGHILNTASMAGLQSASFNPYATSKYAVVAMSEGLAKELAPHGIGVSVLCPSFTRTRIGKSGRNRQERYGKMRAPDPHSPAGASAVKLAELLNAGRDPAEIAARTLAAIRDNELYVITHPEWNWELEKRIADLQVAMAKA
jgi:NAD(P)-dependent dehydrogenase (short-subunit alcohol dehydrogenase family)